MIACSFMALLYEKHKISIKENLKNAIQTTWFAIEPFLRATFSKARLLVLKLFGLVKN